MARLYAFRAVELTDLTSLPLEAATKEDLQLWRKAYHHLRAQPRKPEDYSEAEGGVTVRSFDGEVTLRPDAPPPSDMLAIALRAFCMALGLKRVSLNEVRPSSSFKVLREQDLSAALANTDTWIYATECVFAPGPMPGELWFMDGGQYVTTNWIRAASMRRLLQLEAEDALVSRMQNEGAYPATDMTTLVAMCAQAVRESWDLYFFEPGT